MQKQTPGVMLLLALVLGGCASSSQPAANTARPPEPRAEPDYEEAARINTELGMNYARAGNYDVALDKFQRALKQDDRYAPAHQGIAFIYVQRNDPQRADEHYRRAIRLDTNDAGTRNNYAVFLCGLKRFDEAEKLFNQAATNRDYRERHKAYSNAGVCARRIPDYAKAERYFLKALSLVPEYPEALQQLAGLFLEQRVYVSARAYLLRYEKVGPPTAATLWIGAKTEFALGDEQAAAEYARRLRESFPDSEESRSFTSPSES